MRTIVFPLALIASAGSASAAPVYLECTIDNGERTLHFDVNLNEELGTAGLVLRETGLSHLKMAAAFTPRDVAFASPRGESGLFSRFLIDRSTLEFKEDMILPFGEPIVRKGVCTIAPKIERKF